MPRRADGLPDRRHVQDANKVDRTLRLELEALKMLPRGKLRNRLRKEALEKWSRGIKRLEARAERQARRAAGETGDLRGGRPSKHDMPGMAAVVMLKGYKAADEEQQLWLERRELKKYKATMYMREYRARRRRLARAAKLAAVGLGYDPEREDQPATAARRRDDKHGTD